MWNKIVNISSTAIKQWRSLLVIYTLQLLFGVFVAFLAYQQFDGAIGRSLELDRLARGFDRSVFSDMVNEFPSIIGKLQSGFGYTLLLFLGLSIFLHTGLLSNIRKGEYTISSFFNNAKKYIFKFLMVVLISLLKMVVVLAIIWVPFFRWIGNPLESFHSEKTFIFTVIGLLVLSVLLIIIIWLWSIITRYQILESHGLVHAMKRGWQILKSNFLNYFFVGFGIILLHIIITGLYILAVEDWGAETFFCVFGLIFIQQIFSLIRIWLRAFAYSAIDNMPSDATN